MHQGWSYGSVAHSLKLNLCGWVQPSHRTSLYHPPPLLTKLSPTCSSRKVLFSDRKSNKSKIRWSEEWWRTAQGEDNISQKGRIVEKDEGCERREYWTQCEWEWKSRVEKGRGEERERLEDREREKVSSLSTVALRCEQQEQGEHWHFYLSIEFNLCDGRAASALIFLTRIIPVCPPLSVLYTDTNTHIYTPRH